MKSYYILFIGILFNVNVSAQFGPQQVIANNASGYPYIVAADIDNDNDMDILLAGQFDIAWFENTNGLGAYGAKQIISETVWEFANRVAVADLDGDGDLDVLSSFDGEMNGISKVVWNENLDGAGGFGPQINIAVNVISVFTVLGVDIDNDSDMDVLKIERNLGKISWHENLDGLGNFGPSTTISTALDWPINGIVADIDNDGDSDIVSHSYDGDKIVWLENYGNQGSFSSVKTISYDVDRPIAVYSADIDSDGDLDVISTSLSDNKIAWYENTNGQGSFGPQILISTEIIYPRNLFVQDLDNDGDQDILSSSRNGSYSSIVWFENLDGTGNFSSPILISDEIDFATTIIATDIDQDQDFDVLSASQFDQKIAWYKNLSPLSTPDFKNSYSSMYPNPVKNILHIKSIEEIQSFKVFNQTGQLVLSMLHETEINTENFQSGLYLIQVLFQDGKYESHKIIKE